MLPMRAPRTLNLLNDAKVCRLNKVRCVRREEPNLCVYSIQWFFYHWAHTVLQLSMKKNALLIGRKDPYCSEFPDSILS